MLFKVILFFEVKIDSPFIGAKGKKELTYGCLSAIFLGFPKMATCNDGIIDLNHVPDPHVWGEEIAGGDGQF